MEYDKNRIIDICNNLCKNTLMETLNIEFIDAGEGFLVAKMPVNSKVHQPMGLLHGGASVALAESVGSAASLMCVNLKEREIRGIEISANHLKAKRDGVITGTARLVHKGGTLHLWEIKITDEANNLISICKLTNMVLPRKKQL